MYKAALPIHWTAKGIWPAMPNQERTATGATARRNNVYPAVPARVAAPGTEMPWAVGREKEIRRGNIGPAAGATKATARPCLKFSKRVTSYPNMKTSFLRRGRFSAQPSAQAAGALQGAGAAQIRIREGEVVA